MEQKVRAGEEEEEGRKEAMTAFIASVGWGNGGNTTRGIGGNAVEPVAARRE